MSDESADTVDHLCALASAHGLALEPASLQINEAGLDYRVATGRSRDGAAWVLRVPRRPDVVAKIEPEAAVLDLVAPMLAVAVPDWQIRSDELIAYPLLPGEPGLTVEPSGQLHWRVDSGSRRYARELGDLLADLHAISVEAARAAGVRVRTPAQVRAGWRDDIETVARAFDIAPYLLDRWRSWLADDSYWPSWSVFTHGEIYPAHTLVDDADAITGVLDWTTAEVGDPARDLLLHHEIATPEAFELTVQRYAARGRRVWPRLADHCAEMYAAGPVGYGLYALATGDPQHRDAAATQLNPKPA